MNKKMSSPPRVPEAKTIHQLRKELAELRRAQDIQIRIDSGRSERPTSRLAQKQAA